jgi:hypothetical protein
MGDERRWLQIGLLPLAWTLVTGVGAVGSIILGRLYNHTAEALWGYEIVDTTSVFFALAAHGLLVGAGQALLMRPLIPKAWHWLVATLIGSYSHILIFYVGGTLYGILPIPVAQTLDTALFGVTFALPQWFVLRRYYSRSGPWIAVSALAFAAAHWLAQTPFSMAITEGLGSLLPQQVDARTAILVLSGFDSILYGVPFGAVVALAQGVLIRWWLGPHAGGVQLDRMRGVPDGQSPL